MIDPLREAFKRGDGACEVRVAGKLYLLVPKEVYDRAAAASSRPADAAAGEQALGTRVRQWRRLAGLTQVELALRAEISLETLSRIENGHRDPSVRTLQSILRALGRRETLG